MPEKVRSLKQEQHNLGAAMRAKGETWAAIAEEFRRRYRCSARVAFRLAHGWSQREVADIWNIRWPDEPRTHKNISYWELWPSETGHSPSLETLDRLAEIYECSPSDLLADRPSFARRQNGGKSGIQPRRDEESPSARGVLAQKPTYGSSMVSLRTDGSSEPVSRPNAIGPDPDIDAQDISRLVEWITGTNTNNDAIDRIAYASSYLAKAHTRLAANGSYGKSCGSTRKCRRS